MKRHLRPAAAALLLAAGLALAGCGGLPFLSSPWEGTWWGVENAGMNWSGDEIRSLETFTFTKDGDVITVDHKTQRGGREIDGSLSGTAKEDGGRLLITPKDGGHEVVFSYSRTGGEIETSLQNADGSPVMLKELTEENNGEMEKIRSEIAAVSARPENRVDTTLSRR